MVLFVLATVREWFFYTNGGTAKRPCYQCDVIRRGFEETRQYDIAVRTKVKYKSQCRTSARASGARPHFLRCSVPHFLSPHRSATRRRQRLSPIDNNYTPPPGIPLYVTRLLNTKTSVISILFSPSPSFKRRRPSPQLLSRFPAAAAFVYVRTVVLFHTEFSVFYSASVFCGLATLVSRESSWNYYNRYDRIRTVSHAPHTGNIINTEAFLSTRPLTHPFDNTADGSYQRGVFAAIKRNSNYSFATIFQR